MSLEFCELEGRIIYPSKHAAERELLAATRRKSRLSYLDGIAVERDVRPCTACNGWHVIETTALVAELENDKALPAGRRSAAPELDMIEAGFREHQRFREHQHDMDRAFLFGTTAAR